MGKLFLIFLFALGCVSQTALSQQPHEAQPNPLKQIHASDAVKPESARLDAAGQPDAAQTPVDVADALVDQKKYQEALSVIQQYMKDHADDAEALWTLGVIYEELEDFDASSKALEKASKIKVEDPLRQASLTAYYGDVLVKLERYSEAVKAYDEAIALDPKDSYMASKFSAKQSVFAYGKEYAATVLKEKKACEINFLNKHINQVTVGQLIFAARQMKSNGCTHLVINILTNGGDVASAVSAYYFLRGLGIHIITNNLSSVQSAGLYLYCAGEKRYAEENSYFMHHSYSSQVSGVDANVMNYIYISHLRNIGPLKKCIPEKILNESIDEKPGLEYYWDKSQAVKIGLVNSIEPLSYSPEYSLSYFSNE